MRSIVSFFKTLYANIVALPDHLYPFACEIEGRIVRGRRSYEQAVKSAFKINGEGRFGYKLLLYRESFHFIGALLFIISAGLISKTLFGSDVALYVLLGAAILTLSFQEFYVHPRRYGQRSQKGIADWFTWVFPMVGYILLFRLW